MRQIVLVVVTGFLLAVAAIAQERRPEQNMAGAGLVHVDDGYRGMDGRTFAIPFIMVDSERFFIRGPQAGIHLYGNPNSGLDLIVQAGFGGYEASDSPYFDGMEDRDFTLFAGMQWTHRFNRRTGVSITLTTDVLGNADGMQGSAALNRNWFAGTWMFTATLQAEWISGDVVDYYYGVRPEEARENRPAYRGEASWNPGISLMVTRPFGKRGVFMAIGGYGLYGSGITDSPLVEQNGAMFFMTGVGWSF